MSKTIPFTKYHGTGNDFVLIDETEQTYLDRHDQDLIQRICARRFGVGADGLMILAASKEADFEMIYYNADGARSTMCGNGGRCIVHFAYQLGLIEHETTFMAVDGLHRAVIDGDQVSLLMQEVHHIQRDGTAYVLDTGSPHYVQLADEDRHKDIVAFGRAVRYSPTYETAGINVNLVSVHQEGIQVSTYERGVEDKTLSCGTGVTAAALVAAVGEGVKSPVKVLTDGGQLEVSFKKDGEVFRDIWLTGPAKHVYTGEWPI